MTCAISDLHGYPLERLKILLEKAKFSADDFFYTYLATSLIEKRPRNVMLRLDDFNEFKLQK